MHSARFLEKLEPLVNKQFDLEVRSREWMGIGVAGIIIDS